MAESPNAPEALRKRLRSIGAFVSAVRRHASPAIKGFLLDWVGWPVLLILLFAFRTSWPIVVFCVAVVATIGFVIGSYLAWGEQRSTRLDAEQREAALIAERDQAAIPPDHAEHLRGLLMTFKGDVGGEQGCNYGDPIIGAQEHRESVSAHLPELAADLDRWDAAVVRNAVAPGVLREWIAGRAAQGIDEPDSLNATTDQIWALILGRAKAYKLGSPTTLMLKRYSSSIEDLAIAIGEAKVLRVPFEPEHDLEERLKAAEALLQAIFAEAQTCEAAWELAQAKNALVELGMPLQQSLTRHLMTITELSVRPSACSFCRTYREATALPVSDARRA